MSGLGRTFLRAMAPSDWALVAAGLGVVAGLEVTKPAPVPEAPPVALDWRAAARFPQAAELRRRPEVALNEGQAQSLQDEFAAAPYFAAFAAAPDGGYGWARGFATLAAAEAAALATCEAYGDGCAVAATQVPQGLGRVPALSLSFNQREAWDWAQGQFGPRALALSLDGAWGYGAGATLAEAQRAALADCEAGRRQDPALPATPCTPAAAWQGDLLPP